MIRRARALALSLLAAAGLALTAPGAADADADYIALGDSLAFGVGASSGNCFGTHTTPPCNGYAGLLFGQYQANDGVTHMRNHGSSGAQSGALPGQATTAANEISSAASDTRAVTVDIGGNDLTRPGNPGVAACNPSNWNAPACPLRTNLTTGLQTIKNALNAEDPDPETFAIMAYYNPSVGISTPPYNEAYFDAQLLGLNGVIGLSDTGADVGINDVIYQVADANGATVADPYPAFKTCPGFMSSDHAHPNTVGHAVLASTFPGGGSAPACPSGGGSTPTGPPSTEFSIGNVSGKTVEVTVPGPGLVQVKDANAAKKKKLLLKPSTATATHEGEVTVALKLTKAAKKKLKQKGKVKVKAAITFIPQSGTGNTQTAALKVKK